MYIITPIISCSIKYIYLYELILAAKTVNSNTMRPGSLFFLSSLAIINPPINPFLNPHLNPPLLHLLPINLHPPSHALPRTNLPHPLRRPSQNHIPFFKSHDPRNI